jgi:hypothetical protein
MTNGDWETGQGEGTGNRPEEQPQRVERTDTGANEALLTEGWNSGGVLFQDIFDNIQLVFERLKGPVLSSWAVLIGISLGLTMIIEVVELLLTSMAGSVGSIIVIPLALAVGLAGIVIGLYQTALFGTGRRAVLDREPPRDISATLSDASGRVIRVAIAVVGVILAQAVLFCTVFLVLLALAPVPYIAATRTSMPMGDVFRMGFTWFKHYVLTFVGIFAATIVAAFVVSCPFGLVNAAAVAILPEQLTSLISTGVGVIISGAIQFAYFVVMGTLFYTIDAKESGTAIR